MADDVDGKALPNLSEALRQQTAGVDRLEHEVDQDGVRANAQGGAFALSSIARLSDREAGALQSEAQSGPEVGVLIHQQDGSPGCSLNGKWHHCLALVR